MFLKYLDLVEWKNLIYAAVVLFFKCQNVLKNHRLIHYKFNKHRLDSNFANIENQSFVDSKENSWLKFKSNRNHTNSMFYGNTICLLEYSLRTLKVMLLFNAQRILNIETKKTLHHVTVLGSKFLYLLLNELQR